IHQRIEGFINRLTGVYGRLLGFALGHRKWVLGVIGLLFIGSLGLIFFIGREFFPQVDTGQITIYVRAPSNLRLDATEKRVAAVEQFIQEQIPADEREMIVSEIGLDPDWSVAYSQNSGQQDAVIRIQLTEERRKSSQQYAQELRHLFQEDPRFA